MLENGITVGKISFLHPKCPGCGDRLENSGFKGLQCRNGCPKSVWKEKVIIK